MSDYYPPHTEEWESSTAHPASFAYTVTAPPITQSWSTGSYPYATTISAMEPQYGYGQTLPPPSHGRGVNTNPAYYHHSGVSSSGYSGHYASAAELGSAGWPPPTAGTSSGCETPFSYPQSPNSFSGSEVADGESPGPESTGNPSPSQTKAKRFICLRALSNANGFPMTCKRAFVRKADLQRHECCVHDKHKMERISCPYQNCSRKGKDGFLRKDHLTEHKRHYHHKDIPKKGRRASVVMEGEEVVMADGLRSSYGY